MHAFVPVLRDVHDRRVERRRCDDDVGVRGVHLGEPLGHANDEIGRSHRLHDAQGMTELRHHQPLEAMPAENLVDALIQRVVAARRGLEKRMARRA